VDVLPRGNSLSVVAAGKQHGELPWLCEVKGSEGGSYKAGAQTHPKERRHKATCRFESSAGRVICRTDGAGRGVESRRPRGRIVCATTTPPINPHPNPHPQRVREAPEQPIVAATSETARPQNLSPNPQ